MFAFISVPNNSVPHLGIPDNGLPEIFVQEGAVVVVVKSAASKLGLGNYVSTDVWQTPLSVYVDCLRDTRSNHPSNERKGPKFPLEGETLARITQEIEEAEKTLLAFATERKGDLAREIEQRKRIQRAVERRLAAQRRRRILEEDRILLLYI